MTMASIIGHDAVIESLVAAHASDTVHHAYLLTGATGIGKQRLARAFIALVNCVGDAPTDDAGRRMDACGSCRSCRRLLPAVSDEGTETAQHPDLLEMVLQPDDRSLKIAQIREVLRIVPFPPIEARYRFVLIEPVEAMTEEAANSLLKTLEEPPSRTRFILITSQPDAVLVTIRSRCQRLPMSPLTEAEVERALTETLGVEAEVASAIAPLADGSVGGALALKDDPIMAQRDELLRRLAAIRPGEVRAAFSLAAEIGANRGSLRTFFELLQRLYRDLLLLRTGTEAIGKLSNAALREDVLEPLAARYGVESILLRLELIEETERGITTRNVNRVLSLERLLCALTAAPGREGAATGALPIVVR